MKWKKKPTATKAKSKSTHREIETESDFCTPKSATKRERKRNKMMPWGRKQIDCFSFCLHYKEHDLSILLPSLFCDLSLSFCFSMSMSETMKICSRFTHSLSHSNSGMLCFLDPFFIILPLSVKFTSFCFFC